MLTLDDIKRDLIRLHPTFICPVSGELLDYRESYLVRFKHRGVYKTDVISINGYNKLTEKQKDTLCLSIIQDMEAL